MATTSLHLDGAPFGNIMSLGESAGRLFFYLSPMDPTLQDLNASSTASFTLSEAPLGTCNKRVCAEDPTCTRATFTGHVSRVSASDLALAKAELFGRHPGMARWPQGHHFAFYELVIADIFFLDMYGGARPLSVADYFGVAYA